MSLIAPQEKLLQLDQQHIQLIDELDALNQRLELALDCFSPQSESERNQAEAESEL